MTNSLFPGTHYEPTGSIPLPLPVPPSLQTKTNISLIYLGLDSVVHPVGAFCSTPPCVCWALSSAQRHWELDALVVEVGAGNPRLYIGTEQLSVLWETLGIPGHGQCWLEGGTA